MREFTVREVIKMFERNGWVMKENGTHIKFVKEGVNYTASIPNHGKTVNMCLIRRVFKECDIKY